MRLPCLGQDLLYLTLLLRVQRLGPVLIDDLFDPGVKSLAQRGRIGT
jgi:hypothetical protein